MTTPGQFQATINTLMTPSDGQPRKIRSHAPQDGELHRIADALQAIQRRSFYQLHGA